MVVVHPAYARLMAEAAAIKDRTLSLLDRLLYQLEDIDTRYRVAGEASYN